MFLHICIVAHLVSSGSATAYIGCYEDYWLFPVLSTRKPDQTSNAPDVCANLCRSTNHKYTGLEFTKQCFCGNSLTAVKKPESDCNRPCPGNKSKSCGGFWRISVYENQVCATNPCQYGGSCHVAKDGAEVCTCTTGWKGVNCQIRISACESKPCQNDGMCVDTKAGGYQCNCQVGWRGLQCSTRIPVCKSKPCQNGGTCVDIQAGGYTCKCQVGWEGPKCSANGNLTYNCPVRNGGVDYAQFNPYTDGLKADTIESLAFQTMGNNDAHILLQNNNNDFNNKVVEIVIGGWGNSNSVIRNQQQGPALSDYQGSVLSGSSFLWFWISWNGGCVKVGKGSTVGGSQIMEWCGLDYRINGIRFSYGYGSGGTFIIPLSPPVFKGCFVDSAKRVLPFYVANSETNTPLECASRCIGYAFSGVESGSECYCGKELPTVSSPDSDCNRPCHGDNTQQCGGAWRISVYLN